MKGAVSATADDDAVSTLPAWLLRAALWGLVALLLAPVVAHAYVGWFSQYMADDYSYAVRLRQFGFFGSQIWWYENWSGRFLATFAMNLGMLLGPHAAGLVPIVVLLCWIAAGIQAGREVALLLGFAAPAPIGALLALLVIGFATMSAPSIGQSFYWMTGSVTFVLPLVLSTAFVGLVLRATRIPADARRSRALAVCAFLLPFLAGGCSESFVAMQSGMLATFALLAWIYAGTNPRHILRLLGIGLSGSVTALAIVALAPGNAVREATSLTMGIDTNPPVSAMMQALLAAIISFLSNTLKTAPVPAFAMTITVPLLLAGISKPMRAGSISSSPWLAWTLAASPFLALASMLALMAPAAYAMADGPPVRTLIAGTFVLAITFVVWSYVAGRALAKGGALPTAVRGVLRGGGATAILLCVAGGSLWNTVHVLDTAPEWQAFSQAWAVADESLRRQADSGAATLSVDTVLNPARLSTLHRDSSWWVNTATAEYYGAGAIVGTAESDE